MRLIVTENGPIDRHQPGADVTGLYDDDTAKRLIKEGFLIDADKPARKRKTKAEATDGDQ